MYSIKCAVVRLAYIDKDVNEFDKCFCVFTQKSNHLTNERQTCKVILFILIKDKKG